EDPFKKLTRYAVVAIFVLLILMAAFTFFFSMQSAIGTLFDYQYVELVRAVFSLAVLGIGIYIVRMYLSK
ncbi:MAG TPA: hypothetical protein VIO11_08115, partial [Candidatus Methanoperedens sp.]